MSLLELQWVSLTPGMSCMVWHLIKCTQPRPKPVLQYMIRVWHTVNGVKVKILEDKYSSWFQRVRDSWTHGSHPLWLWDPMPGKGSDVPRSVLLPWPHQELCRACPTRSSKVLGTQKLSSMLVVLKPGDRYPGPLCVCFF